MTRKLLDLAGIGADRLHLAWVSSAEAQRFVDVVTDVTVSIKEQGPFDPAEYTLQLSAVARTVESESIRWLVGKEVQITTKGDIYGRPWDGRSYQMIFDNTLEREYHVQLILAAIKKGQASPRTIDATTGIGLKRISYLLADMEKTGKVEFRNMEERKPVFAAL